MPLLAVAQSAPGAATAAGTARTTPAAQPLRQPSAYPAPPVVQRAVAAPRTAQAPGAVTAAAPAPAPAPASAPPAPVPVQRAPGGLLPTSARTTTAVSAVTARGSSSRGSSGGSADDPPPYEQGGPPPAYTAVAKGQFDPRSLTDFQLDELTHRLISRITRLIRTELRLDRERIGKLRDPRR